MVPAITSSRNLNGFTRLFLQFRPSTALGTLGSRRCLEPSQVIKNVGRGYSSLLCGPISGKDGGGVIDCDVLVGRNYVVTMGGRI